MSEQELSFQKELIEEEKEARKRLRKSGKQKWKNVKDVIRPFLENIFVLQDKLILIMLQ